MMCVYIYLFMYVCIVSACMYICCIYVYIHMFVPLAEGAETNPDIANDFKSVCVTKFSILSRMCIYVYMCVRIYIYVSMYIKE